MMFEEEKQKVSEALHEVQITENELQNLNNNLEKLVDERNKELEKEKQKSIKSLIEGQETERNRIAKELHDGLCVELANTKHKIELAIKETNLEILFEAINKIDEISSTTRNISHNMSPYVLKRYGLGHAFNDFIEQTEKQTDIKFNVHLYGLENRLDETLEISLYRIVQELTANIIKHSRATEAEIQILQNEEKINIVISDNGIGFNDKTIITNNGIGLQNVKSRIEILNGVINIDSQEQHGTTIIIEIQLLKTRL
jgi:signal transduction histidine kinase